MHSHSSALSSKALGRAGTADDEDVAEADDEAAADCGRAGNPLRPPFLDFSASAAACAFSRSMASWAGGVANKIR